MVSLSFTRSTSTSELPKSNTLFHNTMPDESVFIIKPFAVPGAKLWVPPITYPLSLVCTTAAPLSPFTVPALYLLLQLKFPLLSNFTSNISPAALPNDLLVPIAIYPPSIVLATFTNSSSFAPPTVFDHKTAPFLLIFINQASLLPFPKLLVTPAITYPESGSGIILYPISSLLPP